MTGWLKLHRSIKKHWLYEEKREFSKFEAWMDLLIEANYKDNQFLLGNELVECKRGELITSKRKLSETWNWSITKVTNFLKLLEKDNMINHKSNTKNTVISIMNYDTYQDIDLDKIDYINIENVEKIETKLNQSENKNDEKSNSRITEKSNTQVTDSSHDIYTNTAIEDFTKVTDEEHIKRNQKENESKSKRNQKETNKNIKNIKNLKNKDINKYIYSEREKDIFENENLKKISKLYENNLGPIGSVIAKDLIEISNIFKADMFEEAIAIAARGGKETFNMNYVNGILKKWEQANVMNLEDLEAIRNREKKEREVKSNKRNTNSTTGYKNRFHNFEQRTASKSEYDMESMAKRKREEYFKRIDEKVDRSKSLNLGGNIIELNKNQKIG